jgi:hypothetical protein
MKRIHVYYHNNDGKKDDIIYDADAIKAGPARDVLGVNDARGNGIPLNAPLIQIIMPDGGTATFNADNVTILL